MTLDTASLVNAIAQLEEALALTEADLGRYDPRLPNQLRAAAIQAFEFTYELSFKLIRRHLTMHEPSPPSPTDYTFQEIIRQAYSIGLIHSEYVVWKSFRELRGATSHTYQESKAEKVFRAIPAFLAEAKFLLAKLQERNAQ